MFLGKKFPQGLKTAFEVISKHSGEIHYREFFQFIQENVALKGFNLTEKLFQRLFASLDPHKKGFLSERDWEKAFGGFKDLEENVFLDFKDSTG